MNKMNTTYAGQKRSAINNAKAWAANSNETRYVIELDEGEGRKVTQCGDDYIDGPEFNAFDGLLIATVFPDGEVEFA